MSQAKTKLWQNMAETARGYARLLELHEPDLADLDTAMVKGAKAHSDSIASELPAARIQEPEIAGQMVCNGLQLSAAADLWGQADHRLTIEAQCTHNHLKSLQMSGDAQKIGQALRSYGNAEAMAQWRGHTPSNDDVNARGQFTEASNAHEQLLAMARQTPAGTAASQPAPEELTLRITG
jgi:hypothetical protein